MTKVRFWIFNIALERYLDVTTITIAALAIAVSIAAILVTVLR